MRALLHLNVCALVLICGCGPYAYLSGRQHIDFFDSVAARTPDGGCAIHIDAWVYERSWIARNYWAVEARLDISEIIPDPEHRERLQERISPFLMSRERGKQLGIELGAGVCILPKSDDDGHISTTLTLPPGEIEAAPGDMIHWRLKTAPWDRRSFTGQACLLADEGISVISDIDDTIRVTEVLNTKEMVANTFLREYRAVPGMPELYRRWADEHGAALHYLSASPSQLHAAMTEFFKAEGFPAGSVHLRPLRHGSSTFNTLLNLLDAPPEFKIEEIDSLIRLLPRRRYVLIGDSGQKDPEVYAEAARKHPEQVAWILIRDVTCEGPDAPRYQELFKDLPRERWRIFRDAGELGDLPINRHAEGLRPQA